MALPEDIRDLENKKFTEDASNNPAVRTIPSDSLYTERYSYNASGMVEYIGKAAPGSAEDALVWQICKLTYVGTNVTQKDWATHSTAFTFRWDLRATYVYS